MADKDSEDKPSLELPSFGFGRKKTEDKAAEAEESTEPTEIEEPTEPTVVAPPPVEEPAPTTVQPAVVPVPEPKVTKRRLPHLRPTAPASSTAPDSAAPAASTATTAEVEDAVSPRRTLSFPAIGALQAVVAVGALVGVLAVVLTFGSVKLCELARGTDSCGGPGLLLLMATLVALTYAASWLLRGFGISDAGSTSFLAVGLLAVIVMTFFLDVIYSGWMVLVIPLVSMATFALAWWVTTRVVDTDDAPMRARDVRYRE